MIPKKYLLLLAGLVWGAAGFNILRLGLTAIIYILAFLRIILCLCPQNAWTSPAAPLSWGIYRNIPFTIMGILIIILFYKSTRQHHDSSFKTCG